MTDKRRRQDERQPGAAYAHAPATQEDALVHPLDAPEASPAPASVKPEAGTPRKPRHAHRSRGGTSRSA